MANKEEKKGDDVILTRHSIASYKSYGHTVAGDNPKQKHVPANQIIPDVPESEGRDGVKLAREQANKLLDEFNPKTDALFVVSSREARALETAYYYVNEALERGFEIIEHKTGLLSYGKLKFPHVEKVKKHTNNLKNYVRPIAALSLEIPNTFESMVFNSARAMQHVKINWNALNEEDKLNWEKARKIIESNDHGSWGPNFFFHSEKIKEIFPSIETAQEVHKNQFEQIKKLITWGLKKIKQANYEKNIKILGFGHENYMCVALQEYLGSNSIGNCESFGISVDSGDVTLQRRGNWNSLSK